MIAKTVPATVTGRRPNRSRSRPPSGRARSELARRIPATRPICGGELPVLVEVHGEQQEEGTGCAEQKCCHIRRSQPGTGRYGFRMAFMITLPLWSQAG